MTTLKVSQLRLSENWAHDLKALKLFRFFRDLSPIMVILKLSLLWSWKWQWQIYVHTSKKSWTFCVKDWVRWGCPGWRTRRPWLCSTCFLTAWKVEKVKTTTNLENFSLVGYPSSHPTWAHRAWSTQRSWCRSPRRSGCRQGRASSDWKHINQTIWKQESNFGKKINKKMTTNWGN